MKDVIECSNAFFQVLDAVALLGFASSGCPSITSHHEILDFVKGLASSEEDGRCSECDEPWGIEVCCSSREAVFVLERVALLADSKRAEGEELILAAAMVPIVGLGGSVCEIMGRGRTAKVALHRQLVCYALREGSFSALIGISPLSFPQIGRMMCLDHSTVQHAVNKVERMKSDLLLTLAERAALVAAIGGVRRVRRGPCSCERCCQRTREK